MITAYALTENPPQPPADIEDLRRYLQVALEVEHLTIPVYLTGMYTIKPGTNRTAFNTIRSVVMEEMLHLTLAANLLNSVGGTPKTAYPGFAAGYPAALPLSDKNLPLVPLQEFSPAALETFMLIERPRSLVPPNPDANGWTSIGQFYGLIREGLIRLEEAAAPTIFTGPPQRQLGPDDFYNSGGEAFAVTDLASALLAVKVISDQGEGAADTIWDGDDEIFGEEREIAHYFRFKEIAAGRRYGVNDLPRDEPSGPLLDVSWDAYRICGATKVSDYPPDSAVRLRAEEFNQRYARLLVIMEAAFDGNPQAMRHAIPVMLELRDLAQRLYRNPHPDPRRAEQGYHASPTFELLQEHFETARAWLTGAIQADMTKEHAQ
jgi:hypothetical protein